MGFVTTLGAGCLAPVMLAVRVWTRRLSSTRRVKRRALSYRARCEYYAAHGYGAQRKNTKRRFVVADTDELKKLEKRILRERSVLEYEL